MQLGYSVFPHPGSGGRCKCYDRDVRILSFKDAQLPVLRPEIMSPLRDAMAFVYGEQVDLYSVEQCQCTGQGKPFRSNVQHFEKVLFKLLLYLVAFLITQCTVQVCGFYTIGPERVYLILHKRNEG